MEIGPLCSFQLKPQVATTRLTAKAAAAMNTLKICRNKNITLHLFCG